MLCNSDAPIKHFSCCVLKEGWGRVVAPSAPTTGVPPVRPFRPPPQQGSLWVAAVSARGPCRRSIQLQSLDPATDPATDQAGTSTWESLLIFSSPGRSCVLHPLCRPPHGRVYAVAAFGKAPPIAGVATRKPGPVPPADRGVGAVAPPTSR